MSINYQNILFLPSKEGMNEYFDLISKDMPFYVCATKLFSSNKYTLFYETNKNKVKIYKIFFKINDAVTYSDDVRMAFGYSKDEVKLVKYKIQDFVKFISEKVKDFQNSNVIIQAEYFDGEDFISLGTFWSNIEKEMI